MAMDSVELIREAEQKAQKLVSDAYAQAQDIISEAHAAAKRQREEMLSAARQAADEALEVSREEGRRQQESDEIGYGDRCRAVREDADKKREAAIKLVIDRITG